MAPLVVGFDLDMTLVDSRAGIGATWARLAAETGVEVDVEAVTNRLGPPLEHELARWFPAPDVPALAARFRELYPTTAIAPTTPLPGARAALAAVRAHGGRAVVVTAKYEPNARLHLEHLGWDVDAVHGWCWGPGKGEALRAEGAGVYVGDHLGDIAGARAADALAVAVATGPIAADDLRAAGADVVLDDLTAFPGWLDEYVLSARLGALEHRLRELGPVLVAFSGGDSAFLLAAAVRALGPARVTAATAVMERAGYGANAGDRCCHRKAELLDVLAPVAARRGATVVTGTNADDLRAGFRPGIRAAAEPGAAAPLADVGLTKAQVREASRRWGLPTWDGAVGPELVAQVAGGGVAAVEVDPRGFCSGSMTELLAEPGRYR